MTVGTNPYVQKPFTAYIVIKTSVQHREDTKLYFLISDADYGLIFVNLHTSVVTVAASNPTVYVCADGRKSILPLLYTFGKQSVFVL